MAGNAPRQGWEEVFKGPCLRADVLVAILESNGLRPVREQLGPQSWWSGSVLDDCRIYVMVDEAGVARRALTEAEAESEPEPEAESEPEA
jgi:hypothetical protein